MNITLRQLQSFLSVAATGSFTRAAKTLNTMQPTLSQQVRDLELELGVRLFDRTTRRVELTDAGIEFRDIAARIIDDLELATQNARDLADRKRGRLIIAAPPLLASTIVPMAIRDFLHKYPGLNVRLLDERTDQILDCVRTGRADCGIGTFRTEDGIASSLLVRDRLMLFCARGHHFANRKSLEWSDLRDLPLISLTQHSGIRSIVERSYQAAKISFSPSYEASYITTVLAMVEANLGVAVLPSYAWAAARGARIAALGLQPAVSRDIALITRSGRSSNPALSSFTSYLVKQARASASRK